LRKKVGELLAFFVNVSYFSGVVRMTANGQASHPEAATIRPSSKKANPS
jgi:hypothetical protein